MPNYIQIPGDDRMNRMPVPMARPSPMSNPQTSELKGRASQIASEMLGGRSTPPAMPAPMPPLPKPAEQITLDQLKSTPDYVTRFLIDLARSTLKIPEQESPQYEIPQRPSHGYNVAEAGPEVVTAPGSYFPTESGEVIPMQSRHMGGDVTPSQSPLSGMAEYEANAANMRGSAGLGGTSNLPSQKPQNVFQLPSRMVQPFREDTSSSQFASDQKRNYEANQKKMWENLSTNIGIPMFSREDGGGVTPSDEDYYMGEEGTRGPEGSFYPAIPGIERRAYETILKPSVEIAKGLGQGLYGGYQKYIGQPFEQNIVNPIKSGLSYMATGQRPTYQLPQGTIPPGGEAPPYKGLPQKTYPEGTYPADYLTGKIAPTPSFEGLAKWGITKESLPSGETHYTLPGAEGTMTLPAGWNAQEEGRKYMAGMIPGRVYGPGGVDMTTRWADELRYNEEVAKAQRERAEYDAYLTDLRLREAAGITPRTGMGEYEYNAARMRMTPKERFAQTQSEGEAKKQYLAEAGATGRTRMELPWRTQEAEAKGLEAGTRAWQAGSKEQREWAKANRPYTLGSTGYYDPTTGEYIETQERQTSAQKLFDTIERTSFTTDDLGRKIFDEGMFSRRIQNAVKLGMLPKEMSDVFGGGNVPAIKYRVEGKGIIELSPEEEKAFLRKYPKAQKVS